MSESLRVLWIGRVQPCDCRSKLALAPQEWSARVAYGAAVQVHRVVFTGPMRFKFTAESFKLMLYRKDCRHIVIAFNLTTILYDLGQDHGSSRPRDASELCRSFALTDCRKDWSLECSAAATAKSRLSLSLNPFATLLLTRKYPVETGFDIIEVEDTLAQCSTSILIMSVATL
ncbi:hypothetical protein EI94DRAFT_201747 [Lactarius quietus]|nr:hypothetical protein EI94DRAFT_201747 [Lactarius quietus]